MSDPNQPEPGFTDRVMRQIATRPLPRVPLWRRLLRTREVTLRVSPARLLGLSLAVAAALFAVNLERRRPVAPALPVEAAASGPTSMRFALAAPEARAVSLAGDFNGWRPDAAPAERGADGVWRVTLPIPPGSWSYSFIVDGKFVEDPAAETWREDGFGGRNAVVRND